MATRNLLRSITIVLVVGFALSDIASDQAECTDSLVGLAPCLSYVSGSGKVPTPECCKSLGKVLEKSKRCVCILVKDRDAPELNLRLNATKALTLPTTCKAHNPNMSECIDLLHLPSNSKDAQFFNQIEGQLTPNSTGKASPSSSGSESKGTESEKSSSQRRERRGVWEMVITTVWTLTALSFFCC